MRGIAPRQVAAEGGHVSGQASVDALDAVGFHVGHTIKPVLVAPKELAEALLLHYDSGDQGVSSRGPDLDAGDQPVIQDVPEILIFERKADATAPELENVVGRAAAGTAPTPAPTVLGTITQLLELLMEQGVVNREELLAQIDVLLKRKDAGST